MIEQLQEVIPNAPRVRVLGARYSFNDIAAKDGRDSLRIRSQRSVGAANKPKAQRDLLRRHRA
jgi:hypothetical protein